MKKTAIALAMATVLGVAGTAMAANPFTDVPANHWSYASVAKLAQAGIVEGYGDGTFQGNNTMTRYEMAQIVAKAMARSDKADAAQKAMIEKLAAEYSTELNNLGVRVSALEKKTDNVKITGEVRVSRLTAGQNDAARAQKPIASATALRTRLTFTGAINDDWKYVGRYQDDQSLLDGSNESSNAGVNSNGRMNIANVQGPIAGMNVTLGRQVFFSNYGLVFDSYLDGVNFNFGNVVKTNVFFGKVNNDNGNLHLDGTVAKNDLYGANFAGKTGVVNLKAGYYAIKDNNTGKVQGVTDHKNTLNIWELGFDTPIGKDLTLIGTYAKSNVKSTTGDNQDKAWKARINYKAANVAVPHSYTLYTEYRDQKAGGSWDPTGNFDYVYNAKGTNTVNGGFKGFMVGGSYVLAKNVKWESEYYNGKSTVNTDAKAKAFWNAVYFYF